MKNCEICEKENAIKKKMTRERLMINICKKCDKKNGGLLMNEKIKYLGIFSIAFILGAITMYGGSTYHVINSVASLEEAPFMQGFTMGTGTGIALMYQSYYCPDANNMKEFEDCYSSNKMKIDLENAIINSPLTYHIFELTEKYGLDINEEGKDTVLEWIYNTEERTAKGIFGFTVPKNKDEHWKKLYCE